MKICIIIPVHNESQGVGKVVESIRRKGLEVVVIDDGSTGRCGDLAQGKGAVVIRNETRRGKGASLQRGFTYVLQNDYAGLITMDGDGQHAVEDLVHFFSTIERYPLCIITGNRMSNPKGMPVVRRWTNHLMSSLISRICKQRIPDTQCGYRYIPVAILRQLDITVTDYEIETEVLIKASKKGFKIFSVPVQAIYQDEESKINTRKDTVRFFRYLWREWRGLS